MTDYQENTDGTITLNVNAVYPYEGSSRAFSHSVTLRLFVTAGFNIFPMKSRFHKTAVMPGGMQSGLQKRSGKLFMGKTSAKTVRTTQETGSEMI